MKWKFWAEKPMTRGNKVCLCGQSVWIEKDNGRHLCPDCRRDYSAKAFSQLKDFHYKQLISKHYDKELSKQ